MSRNVLLFLLFLSSTALGYASSKEHKSSSEGAVTGVVVTEDGRPAANFSVCTQTHLNQGWTVGTATCCLVSTDHGGRFTIEHLKHGTYVLLATNDAEGYSVWNQSPGQSVTVSEGNPRPQITIHLHNRGSVVLGSITDKETGKIIHNAELSFTGIDCGDVGNVLQDDGQLYVLAIPVNCDVVVIARATGYRGWVYTETANSSRPFLRLAAGQRKLLAIALEPLAKGSAEHTPKPSGSNAPTSTAK